jgi:choline-sulfatase
MHHKSDRPNILLIMTDQQRWDTLGCYGNKAIETPNLDWIASEGTMFRSAYTPVPSCIPARACLMSGMNQWNAGILGMGWAQGPMAGEFPHTLPGELAKAGYHTQGIGKMHFQPQRSLKGFHHTVLDESGRSFDPGFISDYRRWFEKNKTGDFGFVDHGIDWNSWMSRPYHAPEFLHPTNWTVNESIRFLDDRDTTKPFFLKMSFARPHSPYDPPPFYYDLYRNKELSEPYVGQWAAMHDVLEDAAKPDAWRGVRSKEEVMRARAAYYGSIHHIDTQIGRLLMKLRTSGLWDKTMIIFTSDHGDMLGDHNLWRKTYAYEGSAHIPFLIKLPGTMKSASDRKTVDQPVLIQDIMPTLLEAAGVDIPSTVDGSSVLRLIGGNAEGWRPYAHGEHSTCYHEVQEMQYLTDGRQKYIWFPRTEQEQLFDLTNDPGELHDLSGDPEWGEKLAGWRSRLIAELAPRNAGLTDGDRLVGQAGRPHLVSPHYRS